MILIINYLLRSTSKISHLNDDYTKFKMFTEYTVHCTLYVEYFNK